MNFIKS